MSRPLELLIFFAAGALFVAICLLMGWIEGRARERARQDAAAIVELKRRAAVDAEARRVQALEVDTHAKEAERLRALPDAPEFDEAAARDLLKGEGRS